MSSKKVSSVRWRGGLLLALLCMQLSACHRRTPHTEQEDSPELAATEQAPSSDPGFVVQPAARGTRRVMDLRDSCVLSERGVVLDLGTPAADARQDFVLSTQKNAVSFVGHQGRGFRELDQMNQDFSFWLMSETKTPVFEALVRGRDSERIAVYVDGKRMGAARLKPDETRVITINQSDLVLEPGRHRLTLSLSRPKGGTPSADVAWVRLGEKNPDDNDYPATLDQIFSEVTIDKDRQPAIILQPGGGVRCPVWLSENTKLTMQLGIWGAGAAEGEVAIVDEDGSRFVLATDRREKDDKRSFEALSVDLSRFSGRLVELEFKAYAPTDAPRVAFALPTLSVSEAKAEQLPRAQRAIVVLMSSLGTRHTPPQAANNGLMVLNQLVQAGTNFPNYRSSTTSTTALVATLLSGLAPWGHGISDHRHGLATEIATLAGAVETAGGRSSFFSGVPTASAEYGFDRGFELFEETRPQQDLAAIYPLLQAKDWVHRAAKEQGPVLSIIHLRGAHPPFDISRERARALPPAEYGGDLSPRRAAIQLATLRARPARQQHMADEDWKRWAALEKAALEVQSEALGRFIEDLREHGLYDDTLLIVAGDVAPGEPPLIPYNEEAALTEQYLAVPLVIKFPHGHLQGRSVAGLFAPRDITKTISSLLGLDFEAARDAINLSSGHATRVARTRPHIAYRNEAFSMRLGASLLTGQSGKVPQLCFFEIDPTCQTDRSSSHIAMSRSLWLTTYAALSSALNVAPTPPAVEAKGDFENALLVWGVQP